MARRKDHRHHTEHNVEDGVRHVEILGVPHAQIDLYALGGTAGPSPFDLRGREVDPRHGRAASGGFDRGVPVADTDIEHPIAGPNRNGLDGLHADRQEVTRDDRIVADRPHPSLRIGNPVARQSRAQPPIPGAL